MAPAKSPAWKLYSYQNMRGKRVGKWRIITHIRNGHWKAVRVLRGRYEFTTLRLGWFGKVLR